MTSDPTTSEPSLASLSRDTTSLGIFMGTIARSMPQFGLLFMITLLPLLMLSGGITPRESMPHLVQTVMLATPTTHFVMLAQAILYRGAGLEVVWRQFVVLFAIGAALFAYAPASARRSARWREKGRDAWRRR